MHKKIIAIIASGLMILPMAIIPAQYAKDNIAEQIVMETTEVRTTKKQESLKHIEEPIETTVGEITEAETVITTAQEEVIYWQEEYTEQAEIYEPVEVYIEQTEAVEVVEEIPQVVYQSGGKYAGITITEQERQWLAAIVWHEANNQSFEGQQAVAEVVLNRLINGRFPNSIYEVLNAPNQFVSTYTLSYIQPNETNYSAVDCALQNGNILPPDVVYFATSPLNNRVWGWIGGHCFCYI